MSESEADILNERRQARAAKRLVDGKLMALHRLAMDALLDSISGERVCQRALAQVEKWERQSLCSPCYIDAWRQLLRLPLNPEVLRAALLQGDGEGVALRHNTPFGFLLPKIND